MSRAFSLHIFIALLIIATLTRVLSGQEPPSGQGLDKGVEARESDGAATASSTKKSFRLQRGELEFDVIPAFAPMQPLFLSGHKEYDTAGRRFGMFNFHIGRTIGTKGPLTYQYFFEFTPLAIAFNNEVRNKNYVPPAATPNEPATVRRTAFGAGFQPVNFRFVFRPRSRIKPFVQTGVGMMFFNRNMPIPKATFYNFTGDFGGGISIMEPGEGNRRAFNLGFRYFHISNFNTSTFNPGYNASIFYLGYSFLRK